MTDDEIRAMAELLADQSAIGFSASNGSVAALANAALEARAERDQAREWLGAANNEFGSAAWDWSDLWRRIAKLKELSNERWKRAETAEAELTALRDRLAVAERGRDALERQLRVAVGGCDANDGWSHSPISLPQDKGYIFCSECGETMTKAEAKRHTSAAALQSSAKEQTDE